MLNMNVPNFFWSHGVLTAAYLINRLPSRILKFKSPLEILKKRKIDLSHLWVFSCVCYVHVQASNRGKLDSRAVKCAFIGYSTTQKGYKCYDVKQRRVLISRDVKFDESKSFFEKTSENNPQGEQLSNGIPLPLIETRMMETKPIANPIDVKKKLGLDGELL